MNDKTTVFAKVNGPRPNKSLWKIILILSVVLVLSLAVLVGAILTLYRPTPNTEVPFSSSTPSESTPTGGDQPAGTVYTRRDGVYNFLLIGKDRVGMNTDVIMIVSFDTVEDSVNVLQIPRDTYFDLDTGYYKINAMYAYNYNAAFRADKKDPAKAGMEAFVDQIEKNLCIAIDYYALVDLNGFVNLVNAIGGVTIDVPADMKYSDPEQDLYIDIKAGVQKMDGQTAEEFIRFRSGYVEGDLGRVNAQKLMISALMRQIKENISLSTIDSLANVAMQNVTTDIKLTDLIFFGREILNVDLDQIKMVTMPGLDARRYGNSGAWYYILHREAALEAINTYVNVFEQDITDELFDVNLVLTDTESEYLNQIYRTGGKIVEVNADDPDVSIPRVEHLPTVTTAAPDPTVSSAPGGETTTAPETGAAAETDGESRAEVTGTREKSLGEDGTEQGDALGEQTEADLFS